jgi:hypothetical protein
MMDMRKDRCRDLYKRGFVQGPEKVNDESGKTIHPGMTDRCFTVL